MAMASRLLRLYAETNEFQHVETLRRNRQKRHKHREFFVEGVRAINQALAFGWGFKWLLYARDRPLSDWAKDVLDRAGAELRLELPFELLQKLSGKEETSELIAMVAMPADDLARIPVRQNARIVLFDRPANPGNLGSIMRSCDAFGVDGVVITGHAVDLYDPETIGASMGSFFAVPAVRVATVAEVRSWLDSLRLALARLAVVGSSAKATLDVATCDLTRPLVLIVGNETWGMSAGYRELCDDIVTIPMRGSASSLNVAAATSILLYEIDRQRRG
jgi:TrmH family RNA methyltransferase